MKFVQINGETATVTVEDRFTLVEVLTVSAELEQAYNSGCSHVVFDFSKTTYIDSSCISEVIKATRKVGIDKTAIHHATGKVFMALKSARLTMLVKDEKKA